LLLKLDQVYQQSKDEVTYHWRKHIVVYGHKPNLINILHGFFYHKTGLTHKTSSILIVSSKKVDKEIRSTLLHPYFADFVSVMKGTAFKRKDQKRANLDNASIMLCMSNHKTDTEVVMSALAARAHSVTIPIVVQIHDFEFKELLQNINATVVCLPEIKMGLIAQNCLFPGISTLLSTLFNPFGHQDFKLNSLSLTTNSFVRQKERTIRIKLWKWEYYKGMSQGIFLVDNFWTSFEGMTFSEAVKIVYDQFQILLIGVFGGKQRLTQQTLFINPTDYVIEQDDVAFVIAKNARKAAKILQFTQNDGKMEFVDEYAQTTALDVSEEKQKNIETKKRLVLSVAHLPGLEAENYTTEDSEEDILMEEYSDKNKERDEMENAEEKQGKILNTFQELEQQFKDPRVSVDYSVFTRAQSLISVLSQASHSFLSFKKDLVLCGISLTLKDVTKKDMRKTLEKIKSNKHVFQDRKLMVATDQLIVICGLKNDHDNYMHFIAPLRLSHLHAILPIVILVKRPISESEWERLSVFPYIYFVVGSSTSKRDLLRAGVDKASSIIVFSPYSKLTDANSIITYHLLKQLKVTAAVVTVLRDAQSASLLSKKVEQKIKTKKQKRINKESVITSPMYASGNIYVTSVSDFLLPQMYFNEHIVDLMMAFLECRIFQVKADNLQNYLYGEIVSHFVDHKLLPLGLYRMTKERNYVFTNPPPDTKVHESDMIFVLLSESLLVREHKIIAQEKKRWKRKRKQKAKMEKEQMEKEQQKIEEDLILSSDEESIDKVLATLVSQ